MAQLNLGRVKFVWRGAYNPATIYQPDDVVSHMGSAWICKTADTVNVAPAEPSANWDVMARGIVATAFTQALLTAPTAAAARAVLELGTAAVANIGTAAGNVLGADNATAFTIGFLQALNAGEARTALGLADAATTTVADIRSDRQPVDATLTALAAVVTAANKLIYATGADTFATTDLTAFARTLLDDADAAAARATLGINTLPFTKEYVSAEQTITAGGLLTLPHGLGAAPKLVVAFLVCKTAEGGYAVDDVVSVTTDNQATNALTYGMSLTVDATNLLARPSGTTQSLILMNKTTTAPFAITNANWRLVLRAWA